MFFGIKGKMRIFSALILGIIVVVAILSFLLFFGKKGENKISMNGGEISQKELDLGWYYGSERDKKPGTPEHWKHEDDGSRSARWFDAARSSTLYTSYKDIRAGEETTLYLWQPGSLLGEDFVIMPKSIVSRLDSVEEGNHFAVTFSLRQGAVRDEVRVGNGNGKTPEWKGFIITVVGAHSIPKGAAASVSESFVTVRVEKAK